MRTLSGETAHTGYWRSSVLYTCVPRHLLREIVLFDYGILNIQNATDRSGGYQTGNNDQPRTLDIPNGKSVLRTTTIRFCSCEFRVLPRSSFVQFSYYFPKSDLPAQHSKHLSKTHVRPLCDLIPRTSPITVQQHRIPASRRYPQQPHSKKTHYTRGLTAGNQTPSGYVARSGNPPKGA